MSEKILPVVKASEEEEVEEEELVDPQQVLRVCAFVLCYCFQIDS